MLCIVCACASNVYVFSPVRMRACVDVCMHAFIHLHEHEVVIAANRFYSQYRLAAISIDTQTHTQQPSSWHISSWKHDRVYVHVRLTTCVCTRAPNHILVRNNHSCIHIYVW